MPEENSNMDELLKSYAKKRRDEAGDSLEMHPATRQMLQAEVKRTLGKNVSQTEKANLHFSWWAIACCGCALVIAVGLSLPSLSKAKKKSMQMAQAPASASTRAFEADEAPAVAAATAERRIDAPQLSETSVKFAGGGNYLPRENGVVSDSISVTNVATFSLDTNYLVARADDFRAADSARVGDKLSALAKTETKKSPVDDALFAKNKSFGRDNANATEEHLSFVQQQTGKLENTKISQVLTHFQFSQAGNKIRITDADGSVYDGFVLAETDGKKLKDSKNIRSEKEVGFADREQPKQKAQISETNVSFSVAGTNQQLQQIVRFTGNFLNNAASQNKPGAPAAQPTQNQSASQTQQNVSGMIQGTVKVGTNEFFLNAVQSVK